MTREARHHICINHFENIHSIATKTELVKTLRRYYNKEPDAVLARYNVFDSVPTSFIVLANSKEADYVSFIQRFKELSKDNYGKERIPGKHCKENVWLIKPAAMNQGRGIEVFNNDLEAMLKFLESRPMFTYWVVQKYIERPLLYKNRKFDIRVWGLITWKSELFYYRAGYLRTSSEMYELNSKQNYVHLTNNCLQQYGERYSVYEEGNTLSFETLQGYFNRAHGDLGVEVGKHLVPRMKDLMIDCFMAARSAVSPHKRRNSFELLGFDFLVDEDFRVWLIEVNTNPYLGIPNKFIEGLLPKMLNDLFELTLDQCFEPLNTMPKREIRQQFELLYSEKRRVNQRRGFNVSPYPFPNMAATESPGVQKDVFKVKAVLGSDIQLTDNVMTKVEKALRANAFLIEKGIDHERKLPQRNGDVSEKKIVPGGQKNASFNPKRNASLGTRKYYKRFPY